MRIDNFLSVLEESSIQNSIEINLNLTKPSQITDNKIVSWKYNN
jgi:hypothetical protein